MKAMQELQPRMKELQDKYKNDPAKLQAEMGALYKEMGVNPLAGCLPLLVQMPFLIAIFYALQGYPYDPNYVQFYGFLVLRTRSNVHFASIECIIYMDYVQSKLVAVQLVLLHNNKRL